MKLLFWRVASSTSHLNASRCFTGFTELVEDGFVLISCRVWPRGRQKTKCSANRLWWAGTAQKPSGAENSEGMNSYWWAVFFGLFFFLEICRQTRKGCCVKLIPLCTRLSICSSLSKFLFFVCFYNIPAPRPSCFFIIWWIGYIRITFLCRRFDESQSVRFGNHLLYLLGSSKHWDSFCWWLMCSTLKVPMHIFHTQKVKEKLFLFNKLGNKHHFTHFYT